jgi:hypothetical protein
MVRPVSVAGGARWPRRIFLRDDAHKTVAPMWQPGPYIRSRELSSVVEGAHSHVARKTKRWLEYEIRHATEIRET